MALTVGHGPLGRDPAGRTNYRLEGPAHRLYLEPSPRRLRVVVAGEVVADTASAWLLHETGLLPVYYVPRTDVRGDVLAPSDTATHCPFKGDATYHHVEVGGERRDDVVWSYPDPLDHAPDGLGDLVAFDLAQVDAWYEEAERGSAHPRDPYHRCDVVPTDRHVTVRVGDEVIAESDDAVVLFETGLPPRYYLPAADVRTDVLRPSATETACPYKGVTSRYHSLEVGDTVVEDAIWVYDDPRLEVADVAGRLAIYDEKVTLEVRETRFAPPATAGGVARSGAGEPTRSGA